MLILYILPLFIMCCIYLIVMFFLSIPSMLIFTLIVLGIAGVVLIITNLFGSFLAVLLAYIIPIILIAVIGGIILSGFKPDKMVQTILFLFIAEFAFYIVWTNVTVNPYKFNQIASIEVTSQGIGISLEEEQINDIIHNLQQVEYKNSFEVWIDDKIPNYELHVKENKEDTAYNILLYSDTDVGVRKGEKIRYYKAKNPLDISPITSPIGNAIKQNNLNQLMELYGTQIHSLKESINWNQGILTFKVPEQMPKQWSIQIFATEAKGNSFIKRDFLRDVEWKENTTYKMELGTDVFTSLELRLKLDGHNYSIDLLDYIPEDQVYKR